MATLSSVISRCGMLVAALGVSATSCAPSPAREAFDRAQRCNAMPQDAPEKMFEGELEGDVLEFDPWHTRTPVHFRCILGVDRLGTGRMICTAGDGKSGAYNAHTKAVCELNGRVPPPPANVSNVVALVEEALTQIRGTDFTPTGKNLSFAGYSCDERVSRSNGYEGMRTTCVTTAIDVPPFSGTCGVCPEKCGGLRRGLVLGYQSFAHSSDDRPSAWMKISRVEAHHVEPSQLESAIGC
jgi:hypothetical protein